MLILPDGGVLPPRPSAQPGRIAGRTAAMPAALIKERRLSDFVEEVDSGFFCMLLIRLARRGFFRPTRGWQANLRASRRFQLVKIDFVSQRLQASWKNPRVSLRCAHTDTLTESVL